MKSRIVGLLGIFTMALLAFAPAAHATETPNGTVDDQGNRIVFTNGALTAVFDGMGPRIKFYDQSGLMRVEQQVNFRALIEFTDADHNGLFESNEIVAKAILDEGRWTHTAFYSLPAGSGIGINFTQADPIAMSDGHSTLAAGSVTLIVKAYNTTHTTTVDGKAVTISNAEIKIDFVVRDWRFANTSNMLALQVNMHSSNEHYDLEETGGTQTVDGSHDEGATSEHEFHETSDVSQETRLSSGPITSSSTIGFFRFVSTATVTPQTGAAYSVPVTASFKSESERDAGETATFMKLYLAYPNFQGTLVHDPSVGLAQGFPTLYLIVAGAAVAGLLAVVAIRRRHPRVQNSEK
jgi:hypothetical protein